jgi:tripartite-type tricarboxylate transporter receptor subunit TctC
MAGHRQSERRSGQLTAVWIGAALSAAVMLAALRGAYAQTYPDRPIKVVVPFPPGGPVDVTARLLGQQLAPHLGQPTIIENRGGASGAIGAKLAAAADPDGYTILCGNISSLVVTRSSTATAITIQPPLSSRSPC